MLTWPYNTCNYTCYPYSYSTCYLYSLFHLGAWEGGLGAAAFSQAFATCATSELNEHQHTPGNVSADPNHPTYLGGIAANPPPQLAGVPVPTGPTTSQNTGATLPAANPANLPAANPATLPAATPPTLPAANPTSLPAANPTPSSSHLTGGLANFFYNQQQVFNPTAPAVTTNNATVSQNNFASTNQATSANPGPPPAVPPTTAPTVVQTPPGFVPVTIPGHNGIVFLPSGQARPAQDLIY